MKRFKYFVVAAVSAMTLSFTGCSSNGDNLSNNAGRALDGYGTYGTNGTYSNGAYNGYGYDSYGNSYGYNSNNNYGDYVMGDGTNNYGIDGGYDSGNNANVMPYTAMDTIGNAANTVQSYR